MFRKIIEAINVITRLSALLAGFIILALILINSYGVVSRYLLNNPIDWILDVSEILMVGCVFMGTAYIFQHGGHVSVDIAVANLSEKAQRRLSIITTAFVFLFCMVLVWKSGELFWANRYTRTSSVSQLPMFPGYFVVFYGSFLLLLQSVIKIYLTIKES
jgi:TRAP-type C4-dicarboxylate transport system permease small subunit